MNEMKKGRLRVNEIFHSIQGESRHAGRPCVFIRLTYCNLRCSWCDTPYSFYEGEWMTPESIMEQVAAFHCPLVEVTGGEPLMQKETGALLARLCDAGYEVLLETGGHMDISRVDERVKRIVDVKCPGSGESGKVHWANLACLRPDDEVKFVIASDEDYDWARRVLEKYRPQERCTVLFSPAFGIMDHQHLATRILEDGLPVRFQLQMHKYIWAPETRGV
ncbi:MAG: radical SAM protein [Calditrichaeota bacterium]|nr:MAG: radical SAM protein [Calditrichota bacterium]